MRWVWLVLGMLAIVVGGVWTLQGLNIMSGGAMSGHGIFAVAKKDNSPNQPAGTRKEGTSVLHNVQGTPQGSHRQP